MPIALLRNARPLTPRTRFPQLQYRGAARKQHGSGQYWTNERTQTSERYPLSIEVKNKVGVGLGHDVEKKYVRKSAQYARPQIVSPDLCDDTLKYIGKTLNVYKGCDIIDLNPGIGLWSSKVHDYLKPRTHILLEPSLEKFGQWLQPLVDQPNSTYKLIAKDPCEFRSFTELVEEGYLPHQKSRAHIEPPPTEPNNSLLVIGNVAWEPTLPGYGHTSMARQIIHELSQAWRGQNVHAFGPVRMVLWMMNDDARSFHPKASTFLRKSDFHIKKFCDIREMVTSTHGDRGYGRNSIGRDPRYELESVVKAVHMGRELGFEMPSQRRENIHSFAEDVSQMSEGTGILTGAQCYEYLVAQEKSGKSTQGLLGEVARDLVHTQIDVEAHPEKYFDMEKPSKNRKVQIAGQTHARNKLGRKVSVQYNQVLQAEELRSKRDTIVDIGERIYLLECQVLGMEGGDTKKALSEELNLLNEQWDTGINSFTVNYVDKVLSDLDDRICLRTPGRRLLWDDRPYEPLVMQLDEAWPANRMSLLDIEPLPVPKDQDVEFWDRTHDFSIGLLAMLHLSLPEALENLQHGASELVDKVPSLRDPAKGGRLNMNHLRVRMLTPEQVDDLCRAYRDWPFRDPDSDHVRYFALKHTRTLGRAQSLI